MATKKAVQPAAEHPASVTIIEPAVIRPRAEGILDDACIPTAPQVVAHAPGLPDVPLATEPAESPAE